MRKKCFCSSTKNIKVNELTDVSMFFLEENVSFDSEKCYFRGNIIFMRKKHFTFSTSKFFFYFTNNCRSRKNEFAILASLFVCHFCFRKKKFLHPFMCTSFSSILLSLVPLLLLVSVVSSSVDFIDTLRKTLVRTQKDEYCKRK